MKMIAALAAGLAVAVLVLPAPASAAIQVLLESNDNADPGDEVYLLTYDTLDDLVAGDFSAGAFTQIGISSPYSIQGFEATSDGKYHLLLESNLNEDPGDEVFLLTYDNLGDLLGGDFSTGTFTQIGISSPYSIAGMDFSDGAFHLLLESNLNEDPGDEVYLLTYDNLGDLIAGDFSAGAFTQIGISSPYSIAGMTFDPVANGDPGGVVPEPATWALMIAGFGFAGSALRRRQASTSRT